MVDYLQDLVQNIYTNCDMKGFDDYNRAVNDLTKNTKQSARDRIRLIEQEQKAKIRLADYEDKYARKKRRRDIEDISYMTKRNSLIRAGMRLIGAYLSIRTLQNIIQTGSQLQLLQRSIEGLTGSRQDWQFINEQAFKFGVSLDTVAKGYKNFFSSANMAGFGTNQIQGMFSDILLGARSIGASTQQIEGALLALEQMMSKGRVSMEELRRQLGNALPGAFEIGAKAMGVTTMQFNEMVKAGISAQEFVPKFIKTFKEQYANGWKDVEQTVAVAQGRLLVAWQQFTMEFLHGETGKALAEGINALAKLMRSPEFLKFIHVLSRIFTIIVKIFSFCIEKIHILIPLLGAAGIMGILLKYGVILKDIWKWTQLIFASGLLTNIRILTGELWAMISPLLALYAKILLVISAFMILEDLYTGIFHPEKKSLSRREWEGGNTRFGSIAGGKVKNVAQERQLMEDLKAMPTSIGMPSSGFRLLPKGQIPINYAEDKRPQIIPNGTMTGGAAGINFEKEEQNIKDISMGDIHFHINGAGDPYVASAIFQEDMLNLLTGQLGGQVS